jgi:hypothetical protein
MGRIPRLGAFFALAVDTPYHRGMLKPGRRGAIVLAVLAALGLIATGSAWALAHVGLRITMGHTVLVGIEGRVPFRARIEKPVQVSVADALTAKVQLQDLAIPLDEVMQVPLKLDLEVPIDTEIAIDDALELALNVPIEMVLTERELDLSSLEVPLDTEIFIEDTIAVDFVVPVDTEVTTLLGVKVPVKVNVPIKANVPVKQKVRVRDTLKVPIKKLRLPFRATIPIKLSVPLKQSFRVKGMVKAPLRETIEIPIKQTIHPKLTGDLEATVKLEGSMPARLEGELNAEVSLDQPLRAKIGTLRMHARELDFELE